MVAVCGMTYTWELLQEKVAGSTPYDASFELTELTAREVTNAPNAHVSSQSHGCEADASLDACTRSAIPENMISLTTPPISLREHPAPPTPTHAVGTAASFKEKGTSFEEIRIEEPGTVGVSFEKLPPGELVVSSVNAGTCAEQKGMQPGQLILAVNGHSTHELAREEFTNMMKMRPIVFTLAASASTESTLRLDALAAALCKDKQTQDKQTQESDVSGDSVRSELDEPAAEPSPEKPARRGGVH